MDNVAYNSHKAIATTNFPKSKREREELRKPTFLDALTKSLTWSCTTS